MKLNDINQKLTERPGGFGSVMKAKAKKQLSPFMKQRQQAATDDERLIKVAREMKKSLQGWMAKAFRSTGGAKAELTMSQFLGWVKKSAPKYAKGIETYARGDSDYAPHFGRAPAPKKATSKEPQKGKEEGGAKKKRKLTPDEQAGLDKINRGAEEEAAEFDRKEKEQQDLKASKGEDKEPKVDTSASIYEARLRAILEADEEAEAKPEADKKSNKPLKLKDNQIDTLITMGIEKQIELDGGESIVDDPSEVQVSSSSSSSSSSQSSNLDDGDIQNLKVLLDDLGDDIFDAIRKQDGIEQDVKKQLANRIQSLVDDIALNSF